MEKFAGTDEPLGKRSLFSLKKTKNKNKTPKHLGKEAKQKVLLHLLFRFSWNFLVILMS